MTWRFPAQEETSTVDDARNQLDLAVRFAVDLLRQDLEMQVRYVHAPDARSAEG